MIEVSRILQLSYVNKFNLYNGAAGKNILLRFNVVEKSRGKISCSDGIFFSVWPDRIHGDKNGEGKEFIKHKYRYMMSILYFFAFDWYS